MIDVKIKMLRERARVPEFKTEGAACADLYAPDDVMLVPYETTVVPLGFAIQLPIGTQAKVLGRSGLAAKNQIFVTTGTVDSDYRGEVGAIITNGSPNYFNIKIGDRIAQMDVMAAPKVEFTRVEELKETDRKGGFGSTGV